MLLLQTRGGLTAAELARDLEVSIRTIHRDVEELSAAGVPIYAERGPQGGIRLVDGYRTRLTGMTAEEAEALFLAGLPGPAAQLGLGTVVAAAQLKVMAALPNELRSRASRLVERFHLDAAGWFQYEEAVPCLSALAEAVWDGRLVEIRYERGDQGVDRTVAPLGLVLKGGVWYIVATTDAGQIRTYRGSRVASVQILDTRVDRPADFDLAAYWTESSAAYERDVATLEVVIRLPEDRLDRLAVVVGGSVVRAAERLPVEDVDGWIHLRLRLNWPDEAAAQLLAVGSRVEVLEPPEIRTRVAETAARVGDRYRVAAEAAGGAGQAAGSGDA